jgi:predicted DCC family thiol-disulfide oxidoreductase YuxK
MQPVIVLYDSECGVCNYLVDWLISRDRHQRLVYASLQGTTAQTLRKRNPAIPSQAETLVLVRDAPQGGQIRVRGRAVFGALALLPWPWRALGFLGILPPILLDPPYRLFAALRKHLHPTPSAQCKLRQHDAGRFLP